MQNRTNGVAMRIIRTSSAVLRETFSLAGIAVIAWFVYQQSWLPAIFFLLARRELLEKIDSRQREFYEKLGELDFKRPTE